MSPPRRRSSRLRTPAKPHQEAAPRLTALAEHDETPTEEKQPNIPTMATTSQDKIPHTPATGGRIIPPREEMHPSMTHKSTTQKPDSGLRHGFKDINAKGGDQPSGVQQQTPSKIGISSPTFDFKFARPAPILGPEAQRMMDELREEALRIKAKLAAQREEEKRKADAAGISHTGGRKIAQAKGKANRYSDVHMAEFKKMDSIANHASAFRSQLGRITPTTTSLKRTQSKAQLGEREDSQGSLQGSSKDSNSTESDRLENTAPAKRARQRIADDASSARPASRGNTTTTAVPSTPRSKSSSVLASLTTPTQASLARTTSIKHPATQIPTLSKSPSKPNLKSTPRGLPKTATVNNIAGSMTAPSKVTLRTPNKFDRVKSILRHPSFSTKKASKPPTMSSLATSASQSNLEKALPSVPTTPIGVGRVKSLKRVEFTPDTRDGTATSVPPSPSPVKSAISRPASKSTSAFPPRKPVSSHGLAGAQDNGGNSGAVEYPSLAGFRPLPEPPLQAAPTFPPPSVPGTFTFRSDHTISFGKSPEGFGSSPNQATVRQVRRSIFPGSMPGSFPDSNKENVEALPKSSNKAIAEQADIPTVPHGMLNKKRRRIESDEEEERSPKKQKSQVPEGEMLMAPRLHAQKDAEIPKSPAKKRGLTLSRLNMLARPKNRR
ncbi:hypothetical protein ACMFMG_006665 [Clarireedia jacksonii]